MNIANRIHHNSKLLDVPKPAKIHIYLRSVPRIGQAKVPSAPVNLRDLVIPLESFVDKSRGTVRDLLGDSRRPVPLFMLQFADDTLESTGIVSPTEHCSTLFRFFLDRSPFPGQHGSAGRIRPPLLGLPSLQSYPRPGLTHQSVIPSPPMAVPQNVPKTTKLQPEESKQVGGDPGTTGVPQQPTEENEVEGPPLSSKIAPAEAPPSQDIAITLVPVTAVCVLVVGLGMGAWSLRNKYCGNRKTKEDTVR